METVLPLFQIDIEKSRDKNKETKTVKLKMHKVKTLKTQKMMDTDKERWGHFWNENQGGLIQLIELINSGH